MYVYIVLLFCCPHEDYHIIMINSLYVSLYIYISLSLSTLCLSLSLYVPLSFSNSFSWLNTHP